MDIFKNIYDLTRIPYVVAILFFISTVYISKYIIEKYEIIDSDSEQDLEKGTNLKTIIYSVLIGFICLFGYLALFKYMTKDNCDILTDPFCSKLNIV